MTHFTVYLVCNAGQPFRDDGNNDYLGCFGSFYDHYGVYVFQDNRTGDVLYVGESHHREKERKGLGVRIGQHYTHADTGGNFRINWCSENCKLPCRGGDRCSSDCNPSFVDFKRLVMESRLIVFSFGQRENTQEIHGLESALIRELRPRWNKNEPTDITINHECVEEAIACINNLRRMIFTCNDAAPGPAPARSASTLTQSGSTGPLQGMRSPTSSR